MPVRVSPDRAGYIGWLVPLPGQTVELLIPDTDYGDLRRTSILAPLLYVEGGSLVVARRRRSGHQPVGPPGHAATSIEDDD